MDTQIIDGFEFPVMVSNLYMVYPYNARRDDGTGHESLRILVRVRPKKRKITFTAAYDTNKSAYSCDVDQPVLGVGVPRRSSAAVRRFNKEVNTAFDACVGALIRVSGNAPSQAHLIGGTPYA